MGRAEKILSASRTVKEQVLKDLLVKISEGKTVSKNDIATISVLEKELLSNDTKPQSEWYLLDAQTAADFFGVSKRTVQHWSKENGCPKARHGLYDIRAMFSWWKDFVGTVQDSPATEDVKQEYWRAKSQLEKMKVEKERGNLLSKDEVGPIWLARTAEISSGMAALSKRLPPLLDGLTVAEMQKTIDKEVAKLKETFCRTGRFCE